ncbi:HAD-IA family hydrolase [Candidatus Woesearchaeota archaeon]|nr:HAD-IA family hydrolase [Candidatus Woesearchaeota archaeon]
MIKTIIFDLNNVLVTYKRSVRYNDYQKKLGVDKTLFWAAASKHYPEFNLGNIDMDEYFSRTFHDLGIDQSLVGTAIQLLRNDYSFVDGMEDLLKALKKSYDLVLLAGDGEGFLKIKLEKLGLRKYFSKIYATCYEHLRKDGPEIYRRVMRKAGLNADECLFIDDLKEYISAAVQAGISNAIQFVDSRQLIRELNAAGVEVELGS